MTIAIMAEPGKQICGETFDNFDIIRIFKESFEYNIVSGQILENSGFTYGKLYENGVFINGKIHSHCMIP